MSGVKCSVIHINLRPLTIRWPRQISKLPATAAVPAWAACSNHTSLLAEEAGDPSFPATLPFALFLLSFLEEFFPQCRFISRIQSPPSKAPCRPLRVALSAVGITLTLQQLKHFYQEHNNLLRGKAHQQQEKINELEARGYTGWCCGVTVLLAWSQRQQDFSMLSRTVLKQRKPKNVLIYESLQKKKQIRN